MIGFFDYTVILTYVSLLSATTGIILTLGQMGHPYIGIIFLLLSGLCDALDGKVARRKKNRTEIEKNYGIQIDSLSDLVAFGVLPVAIGYALYRNIVYAPDSTLQPLKSVAGTVIFALIIVIMLLYVLAALIRLAYFNVTEEERQKNETTGRKYYVGLPVTSAALIFPTVMLFHYLLPKDISAVYFGVMLLTCIAFVCKFKVTKPGLKGILVMISIGLVEFILLMLLWKVGLK